LFYYNSTNALEFAGFTLTKFSFYLFQEGCMLNQLPEISSLAGSGLLYLGTAKGIHVLQVRTQTGTWQLLKHSLVDHDISALAWDNRQAGQILAGTAEGAVFASSDAGLTWEPAPVSYPGQKIWSITPDCHRPPGAFYIGLTGGHLYYTSDNGATSQEMPGLRALPQADYWWGPFGPAIFHSIIPVEGQPGRVYLGLSVVGVFNSSDSGQSWQDVTANIPRMPHELAEGPHLADIHKLALHPLNPDRLYATTHYGTFRSDDGSQSWENISAGLPFEMTRPLALHPLDPDTVYVIAHEDSPDNELPIIRGQLQVHRSRDGGRSWEALEEGLPAQANCAVLREAFISPASAPGWLYLGTNRGQVFASNNEGDAWQLIAEVASSVRVVRV
jgi:photosystem II stability/assembly factor-like uncharacterized protein